MQSYQLFRLDSQIYFAVLHQQIGRVFAQLGDLKSAERQFEQSISANPTRSSRAEFAFFLLHIKQYVRSKEHCKVVLTKLRQRQENHDQKENGGFVTSSALAACYVFMSDSLTFIQQDMNFGSESIRILLTTCHTVSLRTFVICFSVLITACVELDELSTALQYVIEMDCCVRELNDEATMCLRKLDETSPADILDPFEFADTKESLIQLMFCHCFLMSCSYSELDDEKSEIWSARTRDLGSRIDQSRLRDGSLSQSLHLKLLNKNQKP